MSDQKHRNAYKRYWRNHKNWERRTEEMVDVRIAQRRAYRLMAEAQRDMQNVR